MRASDPWQLPVYRFARSLAHRRIVVDIGCGTGDKLVQFVSPVAQRCIGIDQGSGISAARRRHPGGEWIEGDLSTDEPWAQVRGLHPTLVICSDVIEHLPDPCDLLRRLASLDCDVLISSPDRAHLPGATDLGPPKNPLHIREWSATEFRQLLSAQGFRILDERHFPARGHAFPIQVKMAAWRVMHGRAIRVPRSCMAFLARPSA